MYMTWSWSTVWSCMKIPSLSCISWSVTTLIGVELQGNAQLSYVTAKLTEHSWADRLQLRGQCTNEEYSSANVAAGMTSFIWTIRVQPSWLVAADLTDWADRLQAPLHTAKALALYSWDDALQLVCYSRWIAWQNMLEQIGCSGADEIQLSWQTAAGVT